MHTVARSARVRRSADAGSTAGVKIAFLMRVIIVNRYATAAGGAEKHAVQLAEVLRARGHEVAFLSTANVENVEGRGAFVPLTGTDFWRAAPPPGERLRVAADALWNRRAASAMRCLVRRFRPHVVHLHDLYPQLSAAPAAVAARCGIPVVQTLHNYELISASALDDTGGWLDRSEDPVSTRALRTTLHFTRRRLHVPKVALWIAVSSFVARRYARHGIQAHVLPNFGPTDPQRTVPGFHERRGVLFAGRLTQAKGVPDVVRMAELLPGVPVAVAGWGPLAPEVRAAAARLDNLEYAGFLERDALAERIATSRLVALPSRWQEPAGLAALEAMAHGTPVIAYRSGGLAEYVADSGAGQVISPEVEHLVAETAWLHESSSSWTEMSRLGPRAVETTHSRTRYAEALEELFRSLRNGVVGRTAIDVIAERGDEPADDRR
jgi:glycosyltransferase involved in cell wall biosynthesis